MCRVRKNICQCTSSNDSKYRITILTLNFVLIIKIPKGYQADDHYEQVSINNWPNEINCTDIIKTAPNVVYGVSTDDIETTPNAVYGVSTDGIEITPYAVCGVSPDSIKTTLNVVYGVSTDIIVQQTIV